MRPYARRSLPAVLFTGEPANPRSMRWSKANMTERRPDGDLAAHGRVPNLRGVASSGRRSDGRQVGPYRHLAIAAPQLPLGRDRRASGGMSTDRHSRGGPSGSAANGPSRNAASRKAGLPERAGNLGSELWAAGGARTPLRTARRRLRAGAFSAAPRPRQPDRHSGCHLIAMRLAMWGGRRATRSDERRASGRSAEVSLD